MARQFVGVQAFGSTNDILQRIGSWVRQLRCGNVIPELRIEKKARGNFYVFLGIDTEPGADIPEEVAQVCERAGLTGQRIGPLTLQGIRGMVDPQEFDTSGSDRIP